MPRINGQRIVLREFQENDLNEIRKWVNNPLIVDYVTDADLFLHPHSLEMTEQFLKNAFIKKDNEILFAVADKESDQYIGQSSLYNIDWKNRRTNIDLLIGNLKHTGIGIGQEVIKLMIDHVFNQLNLHKIEAEILDHNQKAINSFTQCGFKTEGKKLQHFYKDGKYHDLILMGLIAT